MHKDLPHVDIIGQYQFITFRTHDSIDYFLKRLAAENTPNKTKHQKIDNYLDTCKSGCYLNANIIDYLRDYLLADANNTYNLSAFCIMPNHLHLLIKQNTNLDKIMHKLKGATAHHINQLLHKSGRFWEKGYYDKAIIDERSFNLAYQYIKNNPSKAGLADSSHRFYGIYDFGGAALAAPVSQQPRVIHLQKKVIECKRLGFKFFNLALCSERRG